MKERKVIKANMLTRKQRVCFVVVFGSSVLLILLLWGMTSWKEKISREWQQKIAVVLQKQSCFSSVECEVDGFFVTLRGEVDSPWQWERVESFVREQLPFSFAVVENQLKIPARVTILQDQGKIRFLDSMLPSVQWLQALQAWVGEFRPDLQDQIAWDEIALHAAVDLEETPPQVGHWPLEKDSVLSDFTSLLEEPAVLVARRGDAAQWRLFGVFPDEVWVQEIESSFEEKQLSWYWSDVDYPRFGAHVQVNGFGEPKSAAVVEFILDLLEISSVQAVMWNGGDGGWFFLQITDFLPEEQLEQLLLRAEEVSGLSKNCALRLQKVDVNLED